MLDTPSKTVFMEPGLSSSRFKRCSHLESRYRECRLRNHLEPALAMASIRLSGRRLGPLCVISTLMTFSYGIFLLSNLSHHCASTDNPADSCYQVSEPRHLAMINNSTLGVCHSIRIHLQAGSWLSSCLQFEKVFVISLPERTDKRDAITLQSSVTNLDFDWVDGVDGADVPRKSLPSVKFLHNGTSPIPDQQNLTIVTRRSTLVRRTR